MRALGRAILAVLTLAIVLTLVSFAGTVSNPAGMLVLTIACWGFGVFGLSLILYAAALRRVFLATAVLIFALSGAALCGGLIVMYRQQFDMEMTWADMTRHVRIASWMLSGFGLVAVLASWRLIAGLRSANGLVGRMPPN